MNPGETLVLFESFHEFLSSKSGRNSFASTFLSLKAVTYPNDGELKDRVVESTKYLIKKHLESELYFCSEEMTDVVEHGAKLFDYTDKTDSSLLPSPTGFCYFARGISMDQTDPEHMIIHALYWVKITDDHYFIIGLNDSFVQQDRSSATQRRAFKEQSVYFNDSERWNVNYVVNVSNGGGLAPGPTDEKKISEELRLEDVRYLTISVQALTQSLFLMLDQHTFVDSSLRATTSHKKRLKRLISKKLPTSTQVIQLRRKYYNSNEKSGTGQPIEYSHRWFVTGHWRWQPYKNQETKETEHKRIWIHPYIKGPDDKPLKTSPKVFALVR